MPTLKTLTRYVVGPFYILAGLNHFVNAPFYVSIMPPYLPAHLELVYLSGVAEIGLGVMLLFRRWVVWAGWGLIALLIAIFPANVHMAFNPQLTPGVPPLLLWLRLPLQAVFIVWAYWYTRDAKPAPTPAGPQS